MQPVVTGRWVDEWGLVDVNAPASAAVHTRLSYPSHCTAKCPTMESCYSAARGYPVMRGAVYPTSALSRAPGRSSAVRLLPGQRGASTPARAHRLDSAHSRLRGLSSITLLLLATAPSELVVRRASRARSSGSVSPMVYIKGNELLLYGKQLSGENDEHN